MLAREIAKNIPADPDEGLLFITKSFNNFNSQIPTDFEYDNYEEYLSYYFLLRAYIKKHAFGIQYPDLSGERNTHISIIKTFAISLHSQLELDMSRKTAFKIEREFDDLVNERSINYEFSQGDYDHVQSLINQLRSSITKSSVFDDRHKARILNRLEKLQCELHKTMGNLDSFWALLGEAGIALGKFGENAKPFVDMIKEIVRIAWKTQARSEELPYDAEIPKID